MQKLCIFCQYSIWNRAFPISVLTITFTEAAMTEEPGLLSVLEFQQGNLMIVWKSCKLTADEKALKGRMAALTITSDKYNFLDMGHI